MLILFKCYFGLAIIILTVSVAGCSPAIGGNEPELNDQREPDQELTETPEGNESSEEQQDPSMTNPDYGMAFSGGEVRLFAYEDKMELEKIFGQPVAEETEELTNADTFTGSYMKRLSYIDTELILFSPIHDGERYYLLNLSTTAVDASTPRGIGLGDSLSSVKEAYPELTRSLDGTTGVDGQYEVRFEETPYTYLHFIIEQGVVVMIRLFHEFA